MFEYWLTFHWNLFASVQLTIFQLWFRKWLGAGQAPSHYLNQWWLVYWRIYASLGLNELTLNSYHITKSKAYIKKVSFHSDLHYVWHMLVSRLRTFNSRTFKYSHLNQIYMFQCICQIFCIDLQTLSLTFHTTYPTHTLKDIEINFQSHYI